MAKIPKSIHSGKIFKDGKEYILDPFTSKKVKAVWRPYSTELGYLAIAWNELHYTLMSLFAMLSWRPKNEASAKAVWYAVDSDFSQRKMLRAVIESHPTVPDGRELPEALAKEILWILNQIDESLRHKRNNALHAPLLAMCGVYDGAVRYWAEAHLDPQNPRAKPLRGKDLIQEFRDYTEQADMLGVYAGHIFAFLSHRPVSWPKRPSSPQAHKKKKTTRRGKRLLPPHLRGAS